MEPTGASPSTALRDPETRHRWLTRCATDEELRHLSTRADVTFDIRCGNEAVRVRVSSGSVTALDHAVADHAVADHATDHAAPVAFSYTADEAAWRAFFAARPAPPHHAMFAMLAREPSAGIDGDELCFAQYAHVVRRVLEIGREVISGWTRPDDRPHPGSAPDADQIVGRYRSVEVAGSPCRIHYEEAGAGQDVLLLHTAGADSRQYHHLMNHPDLRQRCRMVAADLPWHGRSEPLGDGIPGSYELSTDLYASTVMALSDELGLTNPVVVGCSMGGEICLELAHRYPDRLAGVVACEATDQVPGRQTPWARHPQVNQTVFVPEWVDGLMSPHTPQRYRREVWWTYSQGGFGVFYGDICFYSGEWDARERVADIDTSRCPVVMLTGEYDYSCTPEMSAATAAKIPGAVFHPMPELGHFPMAENPPVFARYLTQALDEIGVPR